MTDPIIQPAHRGDRRACFVVPGRLVDGDKPIDAPIMLSRQAGEALAVLASLLICGEEAAAIAFDRLAERQDGEAAAALAHIAHEERHHDLWLRGLVAALPATPRRRALMARASAFHFDLADGGPPLHFARIAALDAAVCLILSRLIRADGPLTAAPEVRRLLSRIRDDEARHVALARRMARRHPAVAAQHAAAAAARVSLSDIFALARAEFATLGVDPDALIADVRRLPPGLLAT